MDEFIKVVKELKKNNNSFVAELTNNKIYKTSGCTAKIVLSEMDEDEEFLMDSIVAVKELDKVLALLLVHANVCGIYAVNITKEAYEILEFFAIEVEYENIILEEKAVVNKLYKQVVKEIDDPLEAYEKLNMLN